MPGVSTPSAIQSNHRMMVDENACAGKLEGNPVRADIEESETFCHLSFIVNVVLDEHKHIVYGVAGDVTEAHRVGCRYLDQMYRKPIKERADIVIVSQGGAPKDANLYQTQKALDNSKHAVKDGGTVLTENTDYTLTYADNTVGTQVDFARTEMASEVSRMLFEEE